MFSLILKNIGHKSTMRPLMLQTRNFKRDVTNDDLNKSDFVGKKALEKAEKKSKIWGIKVKDGIALRGNNISIRKKNIGVISSSTWSPYLECGVGIVRLDLDDIEIGTKVDVISINGEKLMAEICSLPMYDEKGLILRGIDKNIPDKPNPWFEK